MQDTKYIDKKNIKLKSNLNKSNKKRQAKIACLFLFLSFIIYIDKNIHM